MRGGCGLALIAFFIVYSYFNFLALVFRDHNFIRYLHRYFQPYLSWYVGASV